MIEYAEHFADRTLKRTLVRLLGYAPTPAEERERTEIVQCEGPQGLCSEFRLDGRPLFQHRLVRDGGGICSDVLLVMNRQLKQAACPCPPQGFQALDQQTELQGCMTATRPDPELAGPGYHAVGYCARR